MLIFLKKNSRFCAARAGLWKFLCGAKFRHCECTENEQRQHQKTPWILDILAHMNIRPDTYMGFLFCKLTFSSFEFRFFLMKLIYIYIYIYGTDRRCVLWAIWPPHSITNIDLAQLKKKHCWDIDFWDPNLEFWKIKPNFSKTRVGHLEGCSS